MVDGFGRKTGIDVPGESPGLVPDAKWRNEAYDEYSRCTDKAGVQKQTMEALFECGGDRTRRGPVATT